MRRMTERKTLLFLALAVALAGCGDDDGSTTGVMDGGDPPADGAMPDAGPDPVLAALPDTATFGVVSSGDGVASVGFLDANGDVAVDVWIDSGTMPPELTATLGGDVVLATETPEGTVTLLDRFGADLITRFTTGGVFIGQGRFTPESVSLNLQDAVILPGGRGFVSRFGQNPEGGAATEDRGSDLIGFDPETLVPTGERGDLGVFNLMVDGIDPETGDPVSDVPVLARPGRIVRRGDTLVVGLARLPEGFTGPRASGPGAVALGDTGDLGATLFELPGGLANCDQVLPVLGSATDVIVSCKGYTNLGFGEETETRDTVGIVRLSIAATGEASVVSSWEAATADGPLAGWNALSLGGDVVATVAFGDFVAETADELLRIDLSTGDVSVIATGAGQFVLSQGAFAEGGPLLVPDGAMGAIRRFSPAGESFTETAAVTIGPPTLTIRSIAAL